MCGYQDLHGEPEWLGDANRESISAIWCGEEIKELRTKHSQRDLHSLPRCRACVYSG
jgi:hypothetical protein